MVNIITFTLLTKNLIDTNNKINNKVITKNNTDYSAGDLEDGSIARSTCFA